MYWTGSNGETPLMPKTNNKGLMISGFVCREYGFGWQLSNSQLEVVNKFCEKKNCYDVKAAIVSLGKTSKDPLETSPFVRELEYCLIKEGY